MSFGQLPIEQVPPPLRSRAEQVRDLGGDTRFFQFAAHAPEVVEFYWGAFYRDLFFAGLLPVRLKELVRLRLAGLNGCSFCQVGDVASARSHGIGQDEIEAVFALRDGGFPPRERLALTAARHMSNSDPNEVVGEQTRQQLAEQFEPAELVELFVVIGVLTGMARMLVATGFASHACPTPLAAQP
jgi:AhpD family alkylhydroperoxidase